MIRDKLLVESSRNKIKTDLAQSRKGAKESF
jgi:hypothetical protein